MGERQILPIVKEVPVEKGIRDKTAEFAAIKLKS
jgi:hypothetical protein